MDLQRNMGLADQIFRVLMGIVLVYIGPVSGILTDDTLSSVLLSSVAIIIIISSLIGWCPFYHMAGFNSYNQKKDQN